MSELSEAYESLSITEFRNAIGPVFTDVVRKHRPAKIDRGGRESGLLLGVDDALALVQGHEFHPEVYDEKRAVSIWLPEFDLYGRGKSFEEARDDLLAEVRIYVREYLNNSELYMHAPNRAHHFGHVVKAWLADSMNRLADVVFAESQETASERLNADSDRFLKIFAEPTPPPSGPAKPGWLVSNLIFVAGVPEEEVRAMSEEEAQQRWLDFCAQRRT